MTDVISTIGIDVGGTKILSGLIDDRGRIFSTHQCDTRASTLLADIEASVAQAQADARRLGFVVGGIGIGMKGAIDRLEGRLVRSITLGLENVLVVDTLRRRFKLPSYLENDVHAATLGELKFGLGQANRDFVMFNAGTGIAAGYVIDGRLHVGASGKAGEIGHMVVCGDTDYRCSCGRFGCLEDLIHRTRRHEPVKLAQHEVLRELPVAYQLLALALANVVNSLNPSAIACMGGMFLKNLPMIEMMDQAIRHLVLRPIADTLAPIVPAFGGYNAGLLGAGSLPFLRGAIGQ